MVKKDLLVLKEDETIKLQKSELKNTDRHFIQKNFFYFRPGHPVLQADRVLFSRKWVFAALSWSSRFG